MPRLVSLPRPAALLVIAVVYVFAVAAAIGAVLVFAPAASLAWQLGIASAAGTVAVFICSVALDNSSAIDAYWSVAPMVTMPWLVHRAPELSLRALLSTVVVFIWGLRLTWNWMRQWQGLRHEDFRYVDIRRKTGPAYWVVSLLGIHLFPALLVCAGSLPLVAATQSTAALGLVDLLGVAVALGATWLEASADQQLRDFVVAPHEPGAICDRGLWSWSRHPNYLGEILFWWGLFLLGFGAEPGSWRLGAGAAAITLLFNGVSIPLHEKRMAERRPGFPAHRSRVSRLILWPPEGEV